MRSRYGRRQVIAAGGAAGKEEVAGATQHSPANDLRKRDRFDRALIGTADLKDNSVTGPKIAPAAFIAADIARSGDAYSIPRAAISANELSRFIVKSKAVTVPAATGNDAGEATATAKCSGGTALSGGVKFGSDADQHQQIISSFRKAKNAWTATGANYFNEPKTMTVQIYCLKN